MENQTYLQTQNANDITELVFILDKSGSMSGLESDTIGGFNSMIEKQKKLEGEVFVTTVLFSTESYKLHDRLVLSKIKPLTEKDYCPGGGTGLLDAIGNTIEHIKSIHNYIRKEDIPAKTIFIITTDGEENSSFKYNYADIKKLIKEQEAIGWEFIFAAANIDVEKTATNLGFHSNRTFVYNALEDVPCFYEAMDEAISEYRKEKKLSENMAKVFSNCKDKKTNKK